MMMDPTADPFAAIPLAEGSSAKFGAMFKI
jgi:hypothetical protein